MVHPAWQELGDLVVPRACGGCGAPGHRWCPGCTDELAAAVHPGCVVGHLGGVPVWAGGDYRGALRALVRGYKDGGRRDLRPVLAQVAVDPLRAALAAVTAEGGGPAGERPVLVVPAPSRARTRRARGDDPVSDLARAAVARLGDEGVQVRLVLRTRGVARDQSGLSRTERRRNLAGRVGVRDGVTLPRGAAVLLLDDVVTTGATLAACRDALRQTGVHRIGAVCCARVP